MRTKLIINANDFGYTNAINYGIVDAHLQGVVTSATIMSNMPGFNHAVALKQGLPRLGIGVHLVLTCGAPVLKTHERLIDSHGYFHPHRYYKDENIHIMLDEQFIHELRAEWQAQIDRVYQVGLIPTHLDGHHRLFIAFPQTRALAFELAHKYHLPLHIDGDHLAADEVPRGISHVEYCEPAFDNVGFDELRLNRTLKESYYQDLLEKIRMYETVEIRTHPGYINKTIRETSSWHMQRMYVLDELIHSSFAEKVKKDAAFELTTYAALKRSRSAIMDEYAS